MCLTPAATAASTAPRWTETRSGRSLTGTRNTVPTPASAACIVWESDSSAKIEISAPDRSGAPAAFGHGQPLPVAARQQRRNLPAHLTGRVSVTDQPSRRSPLRVADQARGKTYAVDSRKAAWPVKPLTQNLHSRLWREDPLCNGSRCPSKVLGRADPRISAQTR